MLAAVIFSNDYWTFWDVMLLFFVWVPLMMVWFFCIFDVFGRRDIGGWAKALWLLAIIFVPWIGSIFYMIFRPWGEDRYAQYTYTGSPSSDYYTPPPAASAPPPPAPSEPKEKVPTR